MSAKRHLTSWRWQNQTKPVLQLLDVDKPFEVYTDALDKAIGGVLVQEDHPNMFESWKLKDAE